MSHPSTATQPAMSRDQWIRRARQLFPPQRPVQFTNAAHCQECAEHNATLQRHSPDSIGMDELGNPGWDPLSFSNVEGKLYYMPALVRLTLDTLYGQGYIEQLLFHLEYGGQDNDLLHACTPSQRAFIVALLGSLMEHHARALEHHHCAEETRRVLALWSGP